MTLRFLRVGALIFPSCSSSSPFAPPPSRAWMRRGRRRLEERPARKRGAAALAVGPVRPPPVVRDHSRSSGARRSPRPRRSDAVRLLDLLELFHALSSRARCPGGTGGTGGGTRLSVFSSRLPWARSRRSDCVFRLFRGGGTRSGAAGDERGENTIWNDPAGPGKGVGVRRDVVVVGGRVVDGAGRRGGDSRRGGAAGGCGGADVGASRTRRDAASEGGIFLARREEAPFGGGGSGAPRGCRAFAARVRGSRGVFGRTSRVRPMSPRAAAPSSVQIFASIATPRRARRRARPPPRRGAAL